MATTKEKLCGATGNNPAAGHLCICSLAAWHPEAAAHFSAPGMKSHGCDCGESWKDGE
jgi:hypothetical protein